MALMPVPAVPRAMPLLWVSLRLADAMRQSVPVNLTGRGPKEFPWCVGK